LHPAGAAHPEEQSLRQHTLRLEIVKARGGHMAVVDIPLNPACG
jgi:hypothetical protein